VLIALARRAGLLVSTAWQRLANGNSDCGWNTKQWQAV